MIQMAELFERQANRTNCLNLELYNIASGITESSSKALSVIQATRCSIGEEVWFGKV